MSTTVVRSTPVTDELVAEDGALVLTAVGGRSRVVKISSVGQMIRELAAGGVALEELTADLVARLGPPPGAVPEAAVSAAVAELQREGLVTLEHGLGAATSRFG